MDLEPILKRIFPLYYYQEELLQRTKVVALPGKLPVPPLCAWVLDLPAFADFENQPTAGITRLHDIHLGYLLTNGDVGN